MNDNILEIQKRLMTSLERLDNAKENISEEVARSNAISELSNTYIKTCNLNIRLEEMKKRNIFKNKLQGLLNDEE